MVLPAQNSRGVADDARCPPWTHPREPTLTASDGVVVTAPPGARQGHRRRVRRDGAVVVGVDLDGSVEAAMSEFGAGPRRRLVGDVGDPAVLEAPASAAAAGGGLGTLVLNAGVTAPGGDRRLPGRAVGPILGVNLGPRSSGAKVGLPLPAARVEHRWSAISICASQGFGARAAYCASKSGVDGLVRGPGRGVAPFGIRVNAVAPGTVATEMQQSMVASGRISMDGYLARIPMGRIADPPRSPTRSSTSPRRGPAT